MDDNSSVESSNRGAPSISSLEKGSRNKRKYLPEKSLDVPDVSSLSLTEFPRYESLEGKNRNGLTDTGLVEARSEQPKEEEVEKSQPVGWDDPIASQLEELLSNNLHATFRSAIRTIVESGYSEEAAEWAVLRTGLCYDSKESKDTVTMIIDSALIHLKAEEEIDTSKHHLFEDLVKLVQYTMLEMISVVREVKPSLSVAEAMWCLLICDLSLSHACAVEGDSLSTFDVNKVPSGKSSDFLPAQIKSESQNSETTLPNKPYTSKPSKPDPRNSKSETPAVGDLSNLPRLKSPLANEVPTKKESLVSLPVPVSGGKFKSLGVIEEHFQCVSQTTISEEKSGCCKKGGCSVNSKRDLLRQKAFHLEKSYRGRTSKGAFKAKITSWSGLVLDKKAKSPSDSSALNTKITSSKVSAVTGSSASHPEGHHHLSCSNHSSVSPATDTSSTLPVKDTVCALPAANTKLPTSVPPETKPTPKAQISSPASLNLLDYYCGIPYDKSTAKYVPQDEKDEAILSLVPRAQTLQKELQGWTDWANEKVMQAARRLSKEQPELKILWQEKEEAEKFKKDKQMLEENTVKRLSEMEYALANATGQIEMAGSTVCRLEEENSALKEDMETARLGALGTAANMQEALLREQETLKKAQSCQPEKVLLQEELTTLKCKAGKMQLELNKAKVLYDQTEACRKQEEKEKVKLLTQAGLIRIEREQLDALGKAKEDSIRKKGEQELQKYKDDIRKIQSEISALRLESESSTIAALRRGIDVSYDIDSCLMGSHRMPALQGYKAPNPKRLAVFRDNFGAGNVKPERECVMCMTEEMSVFFLPCAHQVLCAGCNVLHEKQGMKDCPSCRTPIQRRIAVRFAKP